MKKPLVVASLLVSAFVWILPTYSQVEKRCGWLDNPTPANWWLTDRQGAWIISTQGQYTAKGMENIPELPDYVETNGYYGYGCVCMDVTTESKDLRIKSIEKVKPLPLSTCHEDPTLPKRADEKSSKDN